MRIVGSVVLGYVVIFVLVFITLSLAYLALGADGTFRPGSFAPSTAWIAVSLLLGFAAALVGGMVCAAVGGTKAPTYLAALVIGLGLVMAIPALGGGAPPEPRTAAVGLMEAMAKGSTPAWLALLNPVVGAAGVMLGARLRRRGTA